MRTADLHYDLPDALIATHPAVPRDAARLMVCRRDTGAVEHLHVRDLPDLPEWSAGDLMVFNRTRVLPALFDAVRAGTGGRVSALFLAEERVEGDTCWTLLLRSGGKPQPGETLALPTGHTLLLLERRAAEHAGDPPHWVARLDGPHIEAHALLARIGAPPLPPYIQTQRRRAGGDAVEPADTDRYNTVFARDAGSVAAPTAGLHFTPALLDRLGARGLQRAHVTLHVGTGTFAPVRAEALADHPIHSERWQVEPDTLKALRAARARGHAVCAVGTTTVRTLESLPADALTRDGHTPLGGDTDLFIRPDAGFDFRFTDRLLTNFHLPRSTLLALVAALPGVGLPRLLDWYARAIAERYRFYSYGDAMLVV